MQHFDWENCQQQKIELLQAIDVNNDNLIHSNCTWNSRRWTQLCDTQIRIGIDVIVWRYAHAKCDHDFVYCLFLYYNLYV